MRNVLEARRIWKWFSSQTCLIRITLGEGENLVKIQITRPFSIFCQSGVGPSTIPSVENIVTVYIDEYCLGDSLELHLFHTVYFSEYASMHRHTLLCFLYYHHHYHFPHQQKHKFFSVFFTLIFQLHIGCYDLIRFQFIMPAQRSTLLRLCREIHLGSNPDCPCQLAFFKLLNLLKLKLFHL